MTCRKAGVLLITSGLRQIAVVFLIVLSAYRIVGITYSAPARMPVGQRALIVLRRV